MNVEQMSVADLLREGKQAMALAMGSVGPDTRVRWEAVMDEIDLRLSVGDLDEGGLNGVDLMREFPLFDENGLDQVEHCCEWCLNEDRKRLHCWLKENGHV